MCMIWVTVILFATVLMILFMHVSAARIHEFITVRLAFPTSSMSPLTCDTFWGIL